MVYWVQVQLRSNWIDILAIPMLASIMEAQPIFAVLVLISHALKGKAAGSQFLNEVSIILLALGLRWWAMGVQAYVQRGISKQNEQLLRVLGLLLAGGLVIGRPVLLIRSILTLMLSSALALWLWWRGIQQGIRPDDEQLLLSFRVGFIILLIVLIFVVFYLDNNYIFYADNSYTVLFTALAQAIPIFFLSSLLALSFTRISLIRHETARYTSDNATGSTRNWLLVLTACWVVVVLAVIALEAFSFQAVVIVVSDVWYVVVIILQWLITLLAYILTPVFYVFSFLFGFLLNLFHTGRPIITSPLPLPSSNPTGQQQQISPVDLAAERFILALLSLIALFFIARAILRRLPKTRKEDEVEEIREGLSLRSIAQQRRNERQERAVPQVPQLETLEPESARAYYRELLQTMASNNPTFARRTYETPTEYQTRLLTFVQHTFSATLSEEDKPSEQEIIELLTHDYGVERYGGKLLDAAQKNYLRTWMPRLIARVRHNR